MPYPTTSLLKPLWFSAVCLAVASATAQAQIVTYTFSQGPQTQFENGTFLTGSMTVDYSLNGNSRLTSANLVLTAPTPFTFGLANLDYFSSFNNTVCGQSVNFDEAFFFGGDYRLYVGVTQANTTAPIPGSSGVRSSLNLNSTGDTFNLSATCISYNNPTASSGGLLNAVTDTGNFAGDGAARVLDANSALGSQITGSDAQRAAGVMQTLPLLVTGAQQAAGTALTGINRVIQSRQNVLRGLSAGQGFIGDQSVWIKPFGSWADQGGEGSVAGFEASTGGLVLGRDTEISPRTRLGVAFSWASASVKSSSVDAPSAANVKIYQLVGYGTHQLGNGSELTFQIDTGRNKTEGRRSLLFNGTTALSRYDSSTWHAGLAWSKTVAFPSGARYTPSVSLDYTRVKDKAYSESGAGAFNLNVASRSSEEIVLGSDILWSRPLGKQSNLEAQLGVGYDFGASRSSLTSAFAGAPGTSFITQGIEPSPWLVRGGAGIRHATAQGTELYWRYDFEGRSGFINQTASVKAVWRY